MRTTISIGRRTINDHQPFQPTESGQQLISPLAFAPVALLMTVVGKCTVDDIDPPEARENQRQN